MEDYFFNAVGRGLSDLVYRKYGGVKVSIMGDKENTFVRTIVYDAPSHIINELEDNDKKERVVFEVDYDITDVDFNIEISVFKKLNAIMSDLEVKLQ